MAIEADESTLVAGLWVQQQACIHSIDALFMTNMIRITPAFALPICPTKSQDVRHGSYKDMHAHTRNHKRTRARTQRHTHTYLVTVVWSTEYRHKAAFMFELIAAVLDLQNRAVKTC